MTIADDQTDLLISKYYIEDEAEEVRKKEEELWDRPNN